MLERRVANSTIIGSSKLTIFAKAKMVWPISFQAKIETTTSELILTQLVGGRSHSVGGRSHSVG